MSDIVNHSTAVAEEGCEALCARGFYLLLAGDVAAAEERFRRALALEPDYVWGYLGLAKTRLPGPGYLEVFSRLIDHLQPQRYVEIGVEQGDVLKRFPAGVRIVGIDPEPQCASPAPEISIFAQTSDRFFAGEDLSKLLGGPFDLAFIDGLHTFEQVLKDFINLERWAGPGSVVLIHDCLPLDRRTATPERETLFWTGDVWKIIPCLRRERPDLALFTIPTYPAGLCVVSGLDPGSRVLADGGERLAAVYQALDFAAIGEPGEYFSLVPNAWPEIRKRLTAGSGKGGPAA